MRFVFAPDSFKGSLTAGQCCDLLESAAHRVFPQAETVSVPVADGGEGTVDALLRAAGGCRMTARVTGPLFHPVQAEWGILADGKTAVIEMAQASGLPLVPPEKRDPRNTTSLGTGELILEALNHGVTNLLIGIGGSATNDGGIGLLTALGASFLDQDEKKVNPVGSALESVARIDLSDLDPRLKKTKITVICDVSNPLLGINGATFIYGPQKGATPEICNELEHGMTHYARVLEQATGRDIAGVAGAGAAGGVGAALGGVLCAELKSGIDAVLDAVCFDNMLPGTSLVVTGEGRIDSQTVHYGKVPAGVARRCAVHGVPVAVLAGGVGKDAEILYDLCESVIFSTANGPISLEEAMRNAPQLYEKAAERLFRTLKIGLKMR